MMPRTSNSADTDQRGIRRWLQRHWPERRWLKIILLIGMAELPFLMWVWLAPLMQPPRFTNHPDQITAALRQHGLTVSKVYLDQGWPDKINNQTYGANLTVYTSADPAAKPLIGRLECLAKKHNCWFRVTKLGIDREGLADLVPVAISPSTLPPDKTWQGRLRQLLANLGIRL